MHPTVTVVYKTVLIICILTIPLAAVFAHEGKLHKAKQLTLTNLQQSTALPIRLEKRPTASLNVFPSYHPLIVHFPIVLLLVAAIWQLISLFFPSRKWDYPVLFLLVGGLLGAFLAGSLLHPHTQDLTKNALLILKQHELYAALTLYSSLAAFIVKLSGILFVKKMKFPLEIITTVVLFFSAICVSIAGHSGAHLTHIEGVGPKGNYIEMEHR